MRERTLEKTEIIAAFLFGGCSMEDAAQAVGLSKKHASRLLHTEAGRAVTRRLREQLTQEVIARRAAELTAGNDAVSKGDTFTNCMDILRRIATESKCSRMR